MTTAETAQAREDKRELLRIAIAAQGLVRRTHPLMLRHVGDAALLFVALEEAVDAAEQAAGRIEE